MNPPRSLGNLTRRALAVLCVLATGPVNASDIVYNHIGSQLTPTDKLVHEHFGKVRQVIDLSENDHTYVYPRGIGVRPNPLGSVYDQDRCIDGTVLILYIIQLDGSVVLPFVAKSPHPALSKEALARIGSMRFRPAQVDGRPVSTVAAIQYQFKCPGPGS